MIGIRECKFGFDEGGFDDECRLVGRRVNGYYLVCPPYLPNQEVVVVQNLEEIVLGEVEVWKNPDGFCFVLEGIVVV